MLAIQNMINLNLLFNNYLTTKFPCMCNIFYNSKILDLNIERTVIIKTQYFVD